VIYIFEIVITLPPCNPASNSKYTATPRVDFTVVLHYCTSTGDTHTVRYQRRVAHCHRKALLWIYLCRSQPQMLVVLYSVNYSNLSPVFASCSTQIGNVSPLSHSETLDKEQISITWKSNIQVIEFSDRKLCVHSVCGSQ
jgi:hypothetical protein